jgi:hypothetical protein
VARQVRFGEEHESCNPALTGKDVPTRLAKGAKRELGDDPAKEGRHRVQRSKGGLSAPIRIDDPLDAVVSIEQGPISRAESGLWVKARVSPRRGGHGAQELPLDEKRRRPYCQMRILICIRLFRIVLGLDLTRRRAELGENACLNRGVFREKVVSSGTAVRPRRTFRRSTAAMRRIDG